MPHGTSSLGVVAELLESSILVSDGTLHVESFLVQTFRDGMVTHHLQGGQDLFGTLLARRSNDLDGLVQMLPQDRFE